MKTVATRRTRPRLSITARAVKRALLCSSIALSALAAQSVLAQTCTETAANEVTCSGPFTVDVAGQVPLANQVADLTIILDDTTTVNPGTGVAGLSHTFGGNAGVTSYADVVATDADAIYVGAATTATVYSYGDIVVDTVVGTANAIDLDATGDIGLAVGGSAYVTGTVDATALELYSSIDGNVSVDLLDTAYVGAIADAGDAVAVSADTFKYAGTIDIANAGAVYAYSAAGNATGIELYGGKYEGTNTVANAQYGSIDVVVGGGAGDAIGIYASNQSDVSGVGGDLLVANAGSITATVDAAGTGEAWGIYAFVHDDGDLAVYNQATGTIDATVTDGPGDAWAISAYSGGVGTITVGNDGTLSATTVYGDGEAYGITAIAYGDGDIIVSNSATGLVYATAGGTAGVGGPAYGVYAIAQGAGDVSVSNDGTIIADAAYGDATGAYLYSALGDVSLVNTGNIYAYATAGYDAVAVSLCANAGATATLGNVGNLTGDVVFACGANVVFDNSGYVTGDLMTGTGNDTITNSGSFTGTLYTGAGDDVLTNDAYFAGYIDMGAGNDTLYNNDEIVADIDMGAGDDSIFNYGDITGTITLGDGDDYVYNDGTITGSIYGGLGDDAIVNEGAIVLDGGTIDLGDPGAGGNSFYNNGTLAVNGDGGVDMGLGNPLAFCNAGGIDMQDGAADDSLTIYGDFACNGSLSVDASTAGNGGLGVADTLTIDGDVDPASVTTINVDLLDELQPGIDEEIPVVYVTGTSVAGNFALGEVDWSADDSFVDVDFSLVSDIDASNATPDVFSLGVEVTGLSDTGTLAAAIGPGVLSLVNSQITTTRQRFGVLDTLPEGGFGLWARVFGDKGSFSPVHGSDDFGTGGNFDWDQRNRGVEAGIDFGVGGNFALGLIAGRSSADLELNDGGIGSADIDATSWGVYGLLMSGGWYLDASYRWIDFDVELDSVAGTLEADGDAKSFNIETGYAFGSPGSFQFVPQLQYTRTRFDAMDPIVSGSGMSFRNDGGDSSRARVGVSLQKSFGDADTGWLFTPYASFSVVREMDGDYDYSVNDALFGFNSVGGTSHLVELGFTGRSERVAVYGGLSWQDGGRIDSVFGGHLGVRYTFGGATPAPAPVAVAVPVKTCAELDDDGDGVNNCEDKCAGTMAGTAVGMDGCPVPAPAPAPEPVMEPKPYRG
jgi:hypothetical protein